MKNSLEHNFEISIESISGDLSEVAEYLDGFKFQTLTQIAPYKNNNIWTALSFHGYGLSPLISSKHGFVKRDIKS